jgi:hypothetical protein
MSARKLGSSGEKRVHLVLGVAVLLLLSACSEATHDRASPSFQSSTPSPGTPTESPGASTQGPATSTCVRGWVTLAAGSEGFTQPLGIIRRTTGVEGPLVVTDMRYFVGPESPPSKMGYLLEVERWYIRLYAKDDPAFKGRFLVEARRFGRGLSAVAPYGTHGFRSPDWMGFQYDSADTTPRSYPGFPGRWEGTPYDFVKGGAGLHIPGLPSEVAGCLDGT